jgi:hypothetical protein
MYAAPLIVIMRHAEKPTATMRGVTETGHKDRHSLTVRGWQRAGALVHLLAPYQGSVQSKALATPAYLFASSSLIVPDKANSSQREWQTLAPLSERLNIRISLDFDVDQEKGAMESALACDGPVLLCWDHHRIADLAGYVPGKHKVPKRWPSKRYDLMYVFTRLASGSEYSFQQVAQPLLGDDRASTLS